MTDFIYTWGRLGGLVGRVFTLSVEGLGELLEPWSSQRL